MPFHFTGEWSRPPRGAVSQSVVLHRDSEIQGQRAACTGSSASVKTVQLHEPCVSVDIVGMAFTVCLKSLIKPRDGGDCSATYKIAGPPVLRQVTATGSWSCHFR